VKLAAILARHRIRSRSLRVRLVALVAAALLPALLFGGWQTLQSARLERTLLAAQDH